MNQPNYLFFSLAFMVSALILHFTPKSLVHLLIIGPYSWTLQEYLAHRFLLHAAFFKKAHHAHHIHPSATSKLFIPMEITSIFAIMNFAVFYKIFGFSIACNNAASSILCYLAFEWTHWQCHRSNNVYGFCEFHILHHRSSLTNFGFTSATWDILFDTCDPKFKKKTCLLLIPFPILPLIINCYM